MAFDVHQATTVASVRDDSGRVLARSILETHGPSIVEFLCGIRGALHVAFEVGTQSQWLHDLVALLADRVVVCDRRRVARQGDKGDQVGADRLSELIRLGGLRPVRRRRAPLTRGLNSNHNRVLKDVFKGAATAAASLPGPLQDFYNELVREEMVRLTLARKIAALTLRRRVRLAASRLSGVRRRVTFRRPVHRLVRHRRQ